ncbi:hypothetical protein ASM33_02530 [Wolbachia endosymbiont of Folsomia candida]|nr:hypothetical protein ASM33_02530 [Wolbachia endosymbiont of Folsomia candida]
MLKILAKSELDLADIQSSIKTKEQVDAINSIDAKKRDMLFNNSRFNSDNKLYIKKLLSNWKVVDLINSMRAETLKALLDNKNFTDCDSFIRLLEKIQAVRALSPVHAERLNMLLNRNKFEFHGFNGLLDNKEAVRAIGLITTEKWGILLNSNNLENYGLSELLRNTQAVRSIGLITTEKLKILLNNNNLRNDALVKLLESTKAVRAIESIAPEKWEMLLSNNNSLISVYLTKLLENEKKMEEINSINIERFSLLLNSGNSYTIHIYLMRLKSLQHVTFDQLSLISANFIAAENGHCLKFQIDKDVKYMDKEKFLVLIKSKLPNIFDPSCDSSCISLLNSRQFICGINSIESAEELQSLIDKFSKDPDGFRNFGADITQRYSNNSIQNQSRLDSPDENIVRNILSRRPDVSKSVVDNSSTAKFAKILNSIKGNIELANTIFDCKLLSDDDVITLYTNENFDAKKIDRNFRFALTLYHAGRINSINARYLLDDTQVWNDLVKSLEYLYGHDQKLLNDLEKTVGPDLEKIFANDGQSTRLQELGIEQLITEPKSYSTQHYQSSL